MAAKSKESLSDLLEAIHSDARKEWPSFSVGDTIKVHYKIVEGDKQRIQIYEGVVISIRGEGPHKSFIVRRISHEVGVERIFPFHSPSIAKIEVVRKGKVRRAKLYYLRGKSGKDSRIKEAHDAQAKMAAEKKAARKAKKVNKKTEPEVATKAPEAPASPVQEEAPPEAAPETTAQAAPETTAPETQAPKSTPAAETASSETATPAEEKGEA